MKHLLKDLLFQSMMSARQTLKEDPYKVVAAMMCHEKALTSEDIRDVDVQAWCDPSDDRIPDAQELKAFIIWFAQQSIWNGEQTLMWAALLLLTAEICDDKYLEHIGDLLHCNGVIGEDGAKIEAGTLCIPENLALWGKALIAQANSAAAAFFLSYAVQLFPSHVELFATRVTALRKCAQYEDALQAFDQVLILNNTDPEMRLRKSLREIRCGEDFLRQGNLEEAQAAFKIAIGYAGDSAVAHQKLGWILLSVQQYEQALAAFNTAVTCDPTSAEAYTGRGWSLFCASQDEQALAAFDRALTCENYNAYLMDAQQGQGLIYLCRKQYELALEAFDKALAADSRSLISYRGRGWSLANLGYYNLSARALKNATRKGRNSNEDIALKNFMIALNACGKAVEAKHDSSEVYERQARVLCALGRYDAALTAFDRAIELAPNSTDISQMRALVLLFVGSNESALEAFEKAIELTPDSALLYLGRGICFSFMNQYSSAIEAFDKAIEYNPTLADAHESRGVALLNTGGYEAAVAAFDKVLELNPDLTEVRRTPGVVEFKPDSAEVHRLRGVALSRMGQYEAAVAAFDKAIGFDHSLPEVHIGRGIVFLETGRYELALKDFDDAIFWNRDNDRISGEAHRLRGIALMRTGQHEAALQAFDKAIKYAPSSPDIHRWRGVALSDIGDHERALEAFDKAIEYAPTFADAYKGRGWALLRMKQYKLALAAFDETLTISATAHDAHYGRAATLFENGQYSAALVAIDSAINLVPNQSAYYRLRGSILQICADYAEAREAYTRSIDFSHTPSEKALVLRLLSEAEMEAGDLALARLKLEEAEKLEPDAKYLFYYWSYYYRLCNDLEASEAWLLKAMNMGIAEKEVAWSRALLAVAKDEKAEAEQLVREAFDDRSDLNSFTVDDAVRDLERQVAQRGSNAAATAVQIYLDTLKEVKS